MAHADPSSSTVDASDCVPAGPPLDQTVRRLVEELGTARAEARRQVRRVRLLSLALAGLVAAVIWSAQELLRPAQAQMLPQGLASPMSAEERAARRAELVAGLPPEARRKLERFEREVDWLAGYMQTWEEGQAGPVIAMMLFRMSENMDAMPSMEEQMRAMSAQMGALPAIVAELNQINAKMHVITASMDSTMGRAGRMMPWMPFSP